jgi:hypothetical protein
MNETRREIDAILAEEVSDEVLESASHSGDKAANFTLSYCTALALCPGP